VQPLAQLTAVPHCPFDPQVWTPPPVEHCVLVGLQTPVQTPPMHAEAVHSVVLPHAPFALQVCTPLPEHCLLAGAHDPVHTPETHASLPQSAGVDH